MSNHQISARYGKLTSARRYLSLVAGFLLCCCFANSLEPIVPQFKIVAFGSVLSIISIICGLSLVILLVSELLVGAGTEIETEIIQDNKSEIEYKFIPSLNRLPLLLVFLLTSFFSIIFGFSSLYAELLRQNPANFSGLQDGFLAIYFSLVTFSTVGYGDIHPASTTARFAAMCEILLAMFYSLVALSTALSWVTGHEREQHEEFIRQRVQEIQSRSKTMAKSESELQDSIEKISI